jgi:hypothetical protein
MLSTVDLLVLTSLDQLNFILKILFTFFITQTTLMWSSTVLSLPPQLVFPALGCSCSLSEKSFIKLIPCPPDSSAATDLGPMLKNFFVRNL